MFENELVRVPMTVTMIRIRIIERIEVSGTNEERKSLLSMLMQKFMPMVMMKIIEAMPMIEPG